MKSKLQNVRSATTCRLYQKVWFYFCLSMDVSNFNLRLWLVRRDRFCCVNSNLVQKQSKLSSLIHQPIVRKYNEFQVYCTNVRWNKMFFPLSMESPDAATTPQSLPPKRVPQFAATAPSLMRSLAAWILISQKMNDSFYVFIVAHILAKNRLPISILSTTTVSNVAASERTLTVF